MITLLAALLLTPATLAQDTPPVNELPDVPGPEGENAAPETRDASAPEASDASAPAPIMDPVNAPSQVMPGSLWRDVSGRQILGFQGGARQVGDLVTVVILEQSTTDLGASTSSNKSNQRSGGIGSLFGLETGVTDANANMGGSIGFEVGGEASFTGGGNTASNLAIKAVVTCTVTEVMPSGNLVVSGTKQVRHYREIQHVTVQGLVRPQDIQMDNTISSELLANAAIEFYGQGTIAERTRPGIGTRVIDAAWPF